MSAWSKEILAGVDTFHINGCPGQIAIFGTHAEAIIMGADKHDVILAVAQYNNGRIAVFSHDSYGYEICQLGGNDPNRNGGDNDDGSNSGDSSSEDGEECENDENVNLVLHKNLRKWLTFDKKPDNELKILEVADISEDIDFEKLMTYDIVVCYCPEEKCPSNLIEEYLKAGGALVHATTPWGFIQLNPNMTIIDFPYLRILHAAGITLLGGVAELGGRKCLPTNNAKLNEARLTFSFHDQDDIVRFLENTHQLAKLNKNKCFDQCEQNDLVCNLWPRVCESVEKMCPSNGIKSENIFQKLILDTWNNIVCMRNECCKAPGIKVFPGDFEDLPPLIDKEVHFESKFEEVHVTSCYVPAGREVTVEVKRLVNNWKILIGAHTDCLDLVKVNRWPVICKKIDLLQSGSVTFSSPYGGCLYFMSSNRGDGVIDATVRNVVPCPEFDLSDPATAKNWSERNNCPGLWANLSGKHVIFTFPRASILKLDDPTNILKMFDELIGHYHNLRQTDVNDYRKIWIVADKQPVAGYMHAGYPIVTHLDVANDNEECFLLKESSFKKGLFWGIFHEIGHNMQLPEWTFEGTGEVTCNIFTLYGMQMMCGIDPWIHPWLKDNLPRALKYLNEVEPSFEEWKSCPEVGLFVFAQLIKYFGWDMLKKLFASFKSYRPKLNSEQDKIDRWFLISSELSGFNLAPLAYLWAIPLSVGARDVMAKQPIFQFPEKDPLLDLVPGRVNHVKNYFLK
ncbi:hypothetical protein HELRODRAFT_188761 [Helobdella robusta]|uniref:Peptidase M60 domain-containing protein n=1 Tax=Helobdella robusta TaxID=6412 RepID=T1FQC1_HELRO|nr:hypothetical protein HELRODRAFT_188761 [Helobdella robusta]ESO02578.1 hypothetical protein HELRODRAFT_188761 [Helobdella robusta]